MATAFLKIANDAFSPLASSITNVESTLTVATGDGNALFPSSFPFHVTIGAEILACTGRTADVLTVTRGVQSTTGAAHAEGEQVELMITAKHVDDLNTAVNTLENSTAELLKDGSRALAGAWNMGSQAVTNINVDSGAIDGAIIGGASAAAVSATTLTATGATVLSGTLSYKGLVPITDPGNAGAIPVTQSGYVPLVTGGAETRTIADPPVVGQELVISLKTDGGNCVITVASPVNQTGNTILTGEDVGDYIHLVAIEDGADKEWRIVANDGWALS